MFCEGTETVFFFVLFFYIHGTAFHSCLSSLLLCICMLYFSKFVIWKLNKDIEQNKEKKNPWTITGILCIQTKSRVPRKKKSHGKVSEFSGSGVSQYSIVYLICSTDKSTQLHMECSLQPQNEYIGMVLALVFVSTDVKISWMNRHLQGWFIL